MAAVSFLREPERWREEIEKCRRRQESDIKSLLGKRREEERERERENTHAFGRGRNWCIGTRAFQFVSVSSL